jgi:hypothetical protein
MKESEGGPIYGFLKRLSEDPDHLEAYRADPEGVMDKSGLTEEHKDVIRSGDPERIEKALRGEGLKEEAPMFIASEL